ncbi:MAG: diguanylate cyclase domain-containing protein [Acidiferrobacter sp.]
MTETKNGKGTAHTRPQHETSWHEKLFAHNTEAILVLAIGPDHIPTRVVDANDEACHIYGYTRDQLLTMTYDELCWKFTQSGNAVCRQSLDPLGVTQKWMAHAFHVTALGRRIHVSLSARPLAHEECNYCLVTVRDITDEDTTRELHHLLALLDNKVLHGTSFEALLGDVAHVLREIFDVAIVDIVTMSVDNALHLQGRATRTPDIATAFALIEKHQPPNLLSLGATPLSCDAPQKVLLQDTPESYPFKTFFTEIGCSELYGLPITHDDTTIGVIKMAFDRHDAITTTALAQIQELVQRLSVLFERQVEQQKLRLRDMALSMVGNAIFITDVRGTMVWANDAMTHMSGYSYQELIGRNPRIFQSGTHSRGFYRDLWKTIRNRRTFRGLITNRKKDGALYTIETAITPIMTSTGQITHFVSVRQDVTERVTSEAVMHRLAKTDHLTGLLNRSALEERVQTALSRSQSDDTLCALIFLDIDRFKAVNDTFGHAVGDIILKEIGTRLTQDIRVTDCVARLGGDEFVILLTGISTRTMIGPWTNHLMKLLSQPIVTDSATLSVTGSIGIALAPDHATDLEGLLQKADIAMYEAKRAGANCWQIYHSD